MKEEIKKIMEMSKAGTITDDQAAQLIAELMKKDKTEEEGEPIEQNVHGHRGRHRHHHHRGPHPHGRMEGRFGHGRGHHGHGFGHRGFKRAGIAGFIHETIHQAMDGAFSEQHQTFGNNKVAMSQVEPALGRDHEFQDNRFHMSSVSDIHLTKAKMNGNRMDASRIHDVSVEEGQFSATTISASSVTDIHLHLSEIENSKILFSKVDDLQFKAGSRLKDSEINSSHVKDVSWKECVWTNLNVFGSDLSDVNFDQVEANNFIVRAMAMNDVSVKNSTFIDVLIKAGEGGWNFRKRGFFDTAFENCRFDKVMFNDCRFTDVVFKNIDIKDLKISGLQLTDTVIDGNEALLALLDQKGTGT